ncbi:Crp/Fnr family transcriptional regulator [Chryseobacterium carnipullorum]|uniref:Crp/Fnr family transcriptional regulator n=1 Tax=Chryseobacterium carnipullorum TaxID=1124835 RepID=A0A376E396_CHRCU|nr:Crp/Fnr family transcriptional regulator [Chryseobacterium carnipullorum]AZA50699.1 Crp/Fnr family transcriptional regulator [Chryseobacterium carnipullorum]AZA65566.1 Crp/Fnr family transcriptional regulator [Chryseobacterium carnipullorum]STD01444.1 Cyclic nucleotide-binding domain [Chryseobacterium carnipullorum]
MIQKLLNSGLHWREKEFKRNEFLKMAGSTDTDIYFIENGSIRIYMMDENEERIIRFGYTGNIIVSLDSFLSGKPSGFYMQAIKKTTVRVAPQKDFYQFIQSGEENLKFWNRILEDLVLQQIEREKDLLINSPRERFNRVLKRSPKLFQEVPNKYIANYLRMSPETLSRLKKS